MTAKPEVLYEARDGAIRFRAVRRATKTVRRVWIEFTNQPGDGDWLMGREIYRVTVGPRGTVHVSDDEYGNPFRRSIALSLANDVQEVADESERLYLRRSRKRSERP